MSVTVTLHIYSGRPDPAWELTDQQAAELADKIKRVNKTTMLKPPGVVGGLGYRGFSIDAVREKNLDPNIYLHAGIIDLDRFDANRITDTPDIEEWLLSTAGNAVEKSAKDYINAEIKGNKRFKLAPADGLSMMAAGPPPFDPGRWNNDVNIRRRNNCYNYANDKITNTFAQPGRGSGQVLSALTCSDVGAAAQRDGQVPVASASSTPAQGHFIALVIWPGSDYHWYRLDNNAMWSHKPGQTPAKNTDNSGNLISSPETCDRGPYTDFCRYFHCIPANTNIS
jgi:hypothetical protein